MCSEFPRKCNSYTLYNLVSTLPINIIVYSVAELVDSFSDV